MEPQIEPNELLLELARVQAELLGLYSQLETAKTRVADRLSRMLDQLEKLFPVRILPFNGFSQLHLFLENGDLQKEAHALAYEFSQLITHLAKPAEDAEDIKDEIVDPPE